MVQQDEEEALEDGEVEEVEEEEASDSEWDQTPQDDPDPSRPHEGRPGRYWFFVDPDYATPFTLALFAYMFPMFFFITMNENPPGDFNMVEGCHNAWYG